MDKQCCSNRDLENHFLKVFNGSLENEVEMDIDTTMETKHAIHREEKLRKVEEKLLSKRTNEKFTNYDGVMSDDNLSLPQKIIHLQKTIGDATRRKILYVCLITRRIT